MSEEYEKTTRFAGIGLEKPVITAKAKQRLQKRKEREKELTTLSKKKRAAKKAASAKTKEERS
jgi:hypothetical protein